MKLMFFCIASFLPTLFIIKDKVVLTTGVSPGSLGGFFVQAIAKAKPSCLILAARNLSKAQETAQEITTTAAPDANANIKIRILELELGSLKSVRKAADQVVKSWDDIPAIDVLVNNAGIMATEYGAADKTLGNREGWAEFNAKSLDQGVATYLYAAFDPDLKVHNGSYLIDCHVGDSPSDTIKPWATSVVEARRLWALSEELVGQEFPC